MQMIRTKDYWINSLMQHLCHYCHMMICDQMFFEMNIIYLISKQWCDFENLLLFQVVPTPQTVVIPWHSQTLIFVFVSFKRHWVILIKMGVGCSCSHNFLHFFHNMIVLALKRPKRAKFFKILFSS